MNVFCIDFSAILPRYKYMHTVPEYRLKFNVVVVDQKIHYRCTIFSIFVNNVTANENIECNFNEKEM